MMREKEQGVGWRRLSLDARNRRAGDVPPRRHRSRRARSVRIRSRGPLRRRRSALARNNRALHVRRARRAALGAARPVACGSASSSTSPTSISPFSARSDSVGIRDSALARPRADRRGPWRGLRRLGRRRLARRARASNFITAGDAVPVKRRVIGTFGEVAMERASSGSAFRRAFAPSTSRARRWRSTRRRFRPTGFADDSVVSVNPKIRSPGWSAGSRPARAHARGRAFGVAAGTGIRPPDAFEIAFTDNPDLKPERSRSVEVGVTQALVGGALSFDATTFFNQYDDLIISVGSAAAMSAAIAPTTSRMRGRAGSSSRRLAARGRGSAVRASYTFLDAEIRAVDGTSQAPSPYHVGDRAAAPAKTSGLARRRPGPAARVTIFASLDRARHDARCRARLWPERRAVREPRADRRRSRRLLPSRARRGCVCARA